jgi:DNA-directed RNA polymerase subunit K/omega
LKKQPPLKVYGNIDSKYRFVIVASKRAKELLKGAKARLKSRSKNPIRIAQNEVKLGLVDFEIITAKKEEVPEPEEHVFLGEEGGGVFGEEHEGPEGEVLEEETKAAGEEETREEAEREKDEEFEPLEGLEEIDEEDEKEEEV